MTAWIRIRCVVRGLVSLVGGVALAGYIFGYTITIAHSNVVTALLILGCFTSIALGIYSGVKDIFRAVTGREPVIPKFDGRRRAQS